jgi:AcrR family transcriptional regulator
MLLIFINIHSYSCLSFSLYFCPHYLATMDDSIRKNIQKTATKLFLKYGLRSVSIDDICNELHISKKTFYTHFTQKEALIDSVISEHNNKMVKRREGKVNDCTSPGNAIDLVLSISSSHLSGKNRQFVSFFFDLNKYYSEIHKRHARLNHERTCETIRQNIKTGIEEGLYREDFCVEMMTNFLAMQFLTMLDFAPQNINRKSYKQGFEFVIDVYMRLLCNQKGLEYYEQKRAENRVEKSNDEDQEEMKDDELEQVINHLLDSEDSIFLE